MDILLPEYGYNTRPPPSMLVPKKNTGLTRLCLMTQLNPVDLISGQRWTNSGCTLHSQGVRVADNTAYLRTQLTSYEATNMVTSGTYIVRIRNFSFGHYGNFGRIFYMNGADARRGEGWYRLDGSTKQFGIRTGTSSGSTQYNITATGFFINATHTFVITWGNPSSESKMYLGQNGALILEIDTTDDWGPLALSDTRYQYLGNRESADRGTDGIIELVGWGPVAIPPAEARRIAEDPYGELFDSVFAGVQPFPERPPIYKGTDLNTEIEFDSKPPKEIWKGSQKIWPKVLCSDASDGAFALASSTVVQAGNDYNANSILKGFRDMIDHDTLEYYPMTSRWGEYGGWNDSNSNTWPDTLTIGLAAPCLVNEINIFTFPDDWGDPSFPRKKVHKQLMIPDQHVAPTFGNTYEPDPNDPLNQGLIAWWPMNEGSGESNYDIVANQTASFTTLTNSDWRVSDGGPSVYYDNTGNVYSSGTLNRMGNKAGTVAIWFNPGEFSYNYIFDHTRIDAAWQDRIALLWNAAAGYFACFMGDDGSAAWTWNTDLRVATSSWDLNKWYHVAFTWDASQSPNAYMYIDGVEVDNVTGNTAYFADESGTFMFGNAATGGGPASGYAWNGELRDCRMWDRALSPDEVARVYAQPYSMIRPSLPSVLVDRGLPTLDTKCTLYGIEDFTVQYWTGSAWSNVTGGNITGNDNVWIQLKFDDIQTDFLKVNITDGQDSTYSRVIGFEAWGSKRFTNWALGRNGATASASSENSTGRYNAENAINGRRKGNYWGDLAPPQDGWNDNTSSTWPDWLQVDFESSKTISVVNVITLQDSYSTANEPTPDTTFASWGITDFDVDYWDGDSWENIPGASVSTNNKVWVQFQFTPITTDKIRLNVTGSTGDWSRVVQLEAWGES